MKTILVTGCSSGLGLAIAVKAAQSGFAVYATMRDLNKRAALDTAIQQAGIEMEVRRLDVQDSDTIDTCLQEIIDAHGRIDTLVNNAGAGYVRTTEQSTEEDVAWIMDVNFHGIVRTTKAALPYMRAARTGHIINITSVGGLVGQPFNEFYCAAKFAVEGYTEALSTYITPAFGVNFSCIEPGGITSEFANSALAHFAKTGGMIDDEYRPVLEKYIGEAQARSKMAESGEGTPVYQTAEQVADVVMACATSPSPPLRQRTSPWAEEICALKTHADPDGTKLQAQVIERFLGDVSNFKKEGSPSVEM